MIRRPRQRVAVITALSGVGFACAYVTYVIRTVSGVDLDATAWTLLAAKTGVELVASGYGIAFLVSAVAFLLMREESGVSDGSTSEPRVGILYLCCDDADRGALESLARLSYSGPLHLVIHDDGRDSRSRAAVDRLASSLAFRRDWTVRVLRRPDKSGGKAGAVNYALDQTAHLFDYFLLCDNDSTVLEPKTIERALAYLEDASDIGGVQLRSVPVSDPAYCRANRRLAESIRAFHAFLAPAARYGWMPFIGHNALLRTAPVRAVGGLTPGFFSDDLDLTVRLNLAGFRIVYAPEIEMGEKHPPSYTAFRKRSYKWAYGCLQTLRTHWWSMLTARGLSFAERLSFFQFTGFYCLQCLLLAYLCFTLLALPLGALGTFVPELIPSFVVGTLLVVLVYAPLLSFYLKASTNRCSGWLTTVALCGLVYGGTDFSVLRGVTDAVRRRRSSWIPTNGVKATAVDPALLAEASFGVVLLAVPVAYLPEILYLPCWFLFAGKFLFGPALSLTYRDDSHDALENAAYVGDGDRLLVGADADPDPSLAGVGAL